MIFRELQEERLRLMLFHALHTGQRVCKNVFRSHKEQAFDALSHFQNCKISAAAQPGNNVLRHTPDLPDARKQARNRGYMYEFTASYIRKHAIMA